MFRRRRNDDDFDDSDGVEEVDDLDVEDDDEDDVPPPLVRPTGPWDLDDAPDPDDEHPMLDLGALRIPLRQDVEIRVDVDPNTQSIMSVTLAGATSVVQVMVFAAPRTTGIWREVRTEIAASLDGSGGSVGEREGPYGTELAGQVPTDQPGTLAAARFVGVDGPRWFLRGMVQGRAAVEPAADPALLEAFGQIVVVRGDEAMAVRDPLPLRLPKDIHQVDPADLPAEGGRATLELPERGPEITETR